MRLLECFVGWSDFFMTVAEEVPKIGLYRAARFVAQKHYAGTERRPGVKELVFARSYEAAGEAAGAEEFYNSAIERRPTFADYRIFLCDFLVRQKRGREAIRAFESARELAQDEKTVAFIDSKMEKLREEMSRFPRTSDPKG